MSAKKSAYINKEGFIEAVESSNFLEGKALAAQIEEAAELLTDDEFFDVKPIKELMKTLHGERRWRWGLSLEGKIKIFNEVVDFKLKDDEWRESLLPQIEKKRDEIAKEGRTAGENSEGSGDKKASKKDERRYQFTGINYKGTTINGGVTLDGCVVLSIGNRGEYTSNKMSEEQVEKLCEQGFFKKMIAKIAEATKDELSDSDFSRAIIKTINQAAEAQSKTYEAFGKSIESYLDDIKDGIVDIKKDINDIKSKVGKIEKETKEAHQKQNEKLDNIEYNSEETKQGIHALQEQVGALSGQLGNALEMLYSINNFAYNAKNGYTTYADKEVAAVLNEQRRYGGVVVNIEFKIGEESYCEQKDPNASLNIKDVEFMKLLAIALTEERRHNRNGNIDIVKTFLERVKGMLGTVNRDLEGKDIKEALQEYVETLKKGDNTDDVEYDENLVGKLSKKYKIAIDNAEKDEDGNISLVVSRGDAANINGWTFCDNNDIKSIKFSRGITQIDEDAINNCKALKSVIFPASIREISEGAISSCDALERLIVESGNRRYRSVNDCIIDIKAHQLVLGCKSSVIPDDGSVLSIRAFAFSGYKGLDIKIPAGIEMIQENAFFNCSGIIKCEVTSKPDGWNGMWASTESELAVKWKEIPKPQTALAVLSTTLPQNMVEASPQKAKENEDKRPQNFALAKDLTKKYGINIIAAEEDESGKYKITISGKAKEIPAEKFKGIEEISHVTIEDGVTSIGKEAFFACKGLTSIVLPDSVTSIGRSAFYGCSGLTSVTIGNGVTSIGSGAFSGCSGLTSIVIPDSVTSIGRRAFGDCSGLTSITIPDSVTSIGSSTFSGCSVLTSVTIPDSVTSIGNDAFRGCSGLTSIVIPNSVTSIGAYAFNGCSGLTSVTIPDSVTSIGIYAFSRCSGLTSIVVEDGNSVYHSDGNCLIETGSKTLIVGCKSSVIPDDGSVLSIRAFAFSGYKGLDIKIPAGIEMIQENAFFNCSGIIKCEVTSKPDGWNGMWVSTESELAVKWKEIPNLTKKYGINIIAAEEDESGKFKITISGKTKEIPTEKFKGIEEISHVTIEDGVTSIGKKAFFACKGLTSIVIPDSVTSIGTRAFYGCSGLTSIVVEDGNPVYHSDGNCLIETGSKTLIVGCKSSVIPNDGSVTSIGIWAFSGCSGLTSVTIPDSVTSIGNYAFSGCSGLTSIVVEDGNPVYHSDGNCLIETGSKTLIVGCKSSVIPNDGSVTSIGGSAFYGCSGLTSVTIPDSVTSIGRSAFYGCSGLTSVTIPDSVTSIGRKAFGDCSGLTSVTIPDSVTNIGEHAFYECSGLTSVVIPDSVTSIGNNAFDYCSGLTSVTIPDSVTSIGRRAFGDCSGLTSVTIPDSVTNIGKHAFYECSGLTSVTIPDSVTSIGRRAFGDCSGLTSVTIGNGVTSIGSGAFSGCSGLTTINFQGTKAQWQAIGKGSNWDSSTGRYTVICTDGTISKADA